MRLIAFLIGLALSTAAFAGSQNIDAMSGLTLNQNQTGPKVGIMDSAGFSAMFHFTGHPKGTLKLQVSNDPSGTVWIDLPTASQAVTDAGDYRFNFDGARDRLVRGVWTHSNQAQITTLTLDAALVAENIYACNLNGTLYSATYAASSDATVQALATALAGAPGVASAVVTVVGGNQTGTDDRVITVTGTNNVPLTFSCAVTLGASQAGVVANTTQNASYGAVNLWIQAGYGF